jgi:signal transduction histidine kinase
VRNLVRNLRPLQIEQLGLTDSLGELLERVAQSTSLKLESHLENVDDVIKGHAATHVYRIVQEALNNVIKHSGADRARFTLERDIKCVRLHLSDFGVGFDTTRIRRNGGLGLTSIAERSQMLGGSLKLQSTPGTGTDLVIELPIPMSMG